MADAVPGAMWCVVKHVRFPLSSDEIMGWYPTEIDAIAAYNQLIRIRPMFTEYSIEHRFRSAAHPYKDTTEEQAR